MGILVNGNGNPHVYAHQDSDLIAGIVGNQTSIMPVGDKFEANQEDANTIALSSGVIITKEGRRIQLDAGTIDEFIIPTGAQDVQSFYIIGYHLYEDGNSDQLCETFVRKMESASDTIPESTFRSGATEVYVSLYRVTQDSLNITDIDLLLPYADSIAEVKRNGGNKNLAAIEDGSTASQPYVAGEFVIVGGQFCEVTASISTNDAFIAYPLPDYNIKAGTVGEQITALNQNLTKINTTTKTLWGYINGVWTDLHIKAWYDSVPVWVDGEFGLTYSDTYNPITNISGVYYIGGITISGNTFSLVQPNAPQQDCGIVFEGVDFTNYSTVTIKTNIPQHENISLNVSGVNSTGYLYTAAYHSGSAQIMYFGVSQINTAGYAHNNFSGAYITPITLSQNIETVNIIEITIE
ncbi:MAG: hypothetical protein IIZ78_02520 [Clostridiales bacterium]|nr:hypothetical protein [Clostridiales bacterium]